MLDALDRAAAHFAVTLHGPPVWGWFGRTAGRPARTQGGPRTWLRVVSAPAATAEGKTWDGVRAAQAALGGLDGRRPVLLGIHDDTREDTAYRAELSEFVGDPVSSATPVLHPLLDLPAAWWQTLGTTLATVASTPTDRTAVRQKWADRAVPEFLGMPAPVLAATETVHGDLHWANLTRHHPSSWTGKAGAPARSATTRPPSTRTPSRCPRSRRASAAPSPSSTPQSAAPPKSWCAPSSCRPSPAATTRTSPPTCADTHTACTPRRTPSDSPPAPLAARGERSRSAALRGAAPPPVREFNARPVTGPWYL